MKQFALFAICFGAGLLLGSHYQESVKTADTWKNLWANSFTTPENFKLDAESLKAQAIQLEENLTNVVEDGSSKIEDAQKTYEQTQKTLKEIQNLLDQVEALTGGGE